MAETKRISADEISKHNTPEHCWIVGNGKSWDITDSAPEHPGGGEIIWKHAGRGATASYSSIHAPSLLPANLDASKLKGEVDQQTTTDEWQKPPPTIAPELKLHEKPPLNTIINAQDFEDVAQRTASKKTWAFTVLLERKY